MHDDDRINEILVELQGRLDQGEELDLEAVLEEYAELANELRPHLKGLFFLDQGLMEPNGLPEGMPESIGEYRIVREIGRGGMGVVYEAEQTSLQRKVAIKLLAPMFTSTVQSVKRFQREARAAGLLQHTNIVPVYAMGKHEGYWYYTMELVNGGSLHQMIEERRQSKKEENARRAFYRQVAEMFAGVADGLDATHKAGIIHRDIKPANLLLNDEGRLKIVDFGMARLDEAPSLTLSGEVLGTPMYMSPEQARAKIHDIDYRTDIYSLGATLYEALTLKPPFKGKSALAIRSQIITRDPLPPRKWDRHIPKDLAVICTKAMEKDRKDRYPTAGEMAKDLLRFAEGLPILSRPIGLIGRSFRKIKRHKVRSTLVASTVLLAMAAIVFGIRTYFVTEQNRILEYKQYLVRAQQEFRYSFARASSSMFDPHDLPGNTALEFFGKAIACLPEEPDAYWLRAISPSRTMKERMDDLDQAVRYGFPERTAKLLRAYIQRLRSGWMLTPESKIIYEDASRVDYESATDLFAKAMILEVLGAPEKSLNMLEHAIKMTGSASTIHFLSRRNRARLRLHSGNVAGTLEDLWWIMAHGDSSPETLLSIAVCWTRMDRKEKGQAFFEDAMQKLRGLGSSSKWIEAYTVCRRNAKPFWGDLISREALRFYPEDPNIQLARARACLNIDMYDEALELTDRILAKQPNFHAAYSTRFAIFLKKGDFNKAFNAAEGAIEKDPRCRCGYFFKGVLLWNHLNRPDEALAPFEKAVKLSPGWADALYNKGTLMVVLNLEERFDEALACFDRVEQLIAPNAFEDLNVMARCRGNIYRMREDFKNAVAAYTKAIEYNEQDVDAYQFRGALRCDVFEKYQEAIEDFEKAIEYADDPVQSMISKGIAYLKMGQYGQALDACNEAIEKKPDDVKALFIRGDILRTKLDKPAEALLDFKKILKIDPTHISALDGCAKIYSSDEDYEKARQNYGTIADLMPNNANAHFNVALMLRRLHRYDEAHIEFKKVILLDPENRHAHVRIGEYLSERGELEEAIPAFKQALKIDPDNVRSRQWLGSLYERQGKMLEAVAQYRKAADIKPDSTNDILNCVNILLYNLRKPDEALEAVEQALEIDPENLEFISIRGLIHANLGQFHEARADIEKARRAKPPIANALSNCREALTWYLCDYKEALSTAEEYVKAMGTPSPDREVALAYYKAYCLRGLDRKVEAQKLAQSAVNEEQLTTQVEPSHYTAYLYAVAGDRDQAEAILMSLEEPNDAVGLDNLSRVHAVLGNDERAMELLDRAAELGLPLYPPQPDMGPDFEHLKDDPRYQAILAKIQK